MNDSSLLQKDRKHIWHPFTQARTDFGLAVVKKGEGAWLELEDGKRLLDLVSSWWVNIHGHANPAIAAAISEQAGKLEQVIFAGFTHEPAIDLASRIAGILPGDLNRVFFSDNGSTAVEVALKMALQSYSNRGYKRTKVVALQGAYHGDTVAAMSAGASSGFFDAYQPFLFQVHSLPLPHTWHEDANVEAKETAALAEAEQYFAEFGQETAALIVEPLVQGAGGMRMYRPSFLQALCAMARQAGVQVIFDEVMTGFGRTGPIFACEQLDFVPDIICLSKGLTGGFLPMSLTVTNESLYEIFLDDRFDKSLVHGHSYTANPIACAAALASLDILLDPACDRARKMIAAVHENGLERLRELPRLSRTRAVGTVAAMDLDSTESGYRASISSEIKKQAMENGLLLRPLGNVLYLMPPYCISEDDLNGAYGKIAIMLEKLVSGNAL